MRIKDIAKIIEDSFPKRYAMERDNVGLLVGDENSDVTRVLVCCDVDEYVAREAVEKGVQLIVSHHPLMFFGIQQLNEDNPEQRALRFLIKHDIALYAAHTNLDVARGGINDYMADMLSLGETEVIDIVETEGDICHGYGRLAKLSEPITLKSMLERCREVLVLDGCRYVGELDDTISTVAINTGGGAGIMNLCFEKKADLLITGDVKYNPARDAYERHMAVIDVAHYDTEKIAMDFFAEFFSREIPELEVVKSVANKRIFKIFS